MIGNWIKETTTTSGTGNITLAGAVTGFCTFDSQFPNATLRYFHYVIEDGNNREYGLGHLTAATTLVRDDVYATLVSGTYTSGNDITKITLSGGTAYVYCDIGAEWGMTQGVKSATTLGVSPEGYAGASTQNSGRDGGFQWNYPFMLPIGGLYSGVRININATGSGALKVGIYDIDNAGLPDRRIANRASGLTLATGAQDVSFDANVFLLPRRYYYFALLTDNTATWVCPQEYCYPMGGPLGATDAKANNALYIGQTYANGILSPFSGSPSVESGARGIPCISFLRA